MKAKPKAPKASTQPAKLSPEAQTSLEKLARRWLVELFHMANVGGSWLDRQRTVTRKEYMAAGNAFWFTDVVSPLRVKELYRGASPTAKEFRKLRRRLRDPNFSKSHSADFFQPFRMAGIRDDKGCKGVAVILARSPIRLKGVFATQREAAAHLQACGWIARMHPISYLPMDVPGPRPSLRVKYLLPYDKEYVRERGRLYGEAGVYGLAFSFLRRAEQLDPSDELTQFDLGVLLVKTKRWADAEKRFRKLLRMPCRGRLRLRNVVQHYVAQCLLQRHGDAAEAEALVLQLLKVRPKEPHYWLTLAQVQDRLGRDAWPAVNKVFELAPESKLAEEALQLVEHRQTAKKAAKRVRR